MTSTWVSNIAIFILMVLLGACQESVPTGNYHFKNNKSDDYGAVAYFKDSGDEIRYSLQQSIDGKSVVGAMSYDVGQRAKTCKHEKLLICMDEPFALYLPKSNLFKKYRNRNGIIYSIEIVGDPNNKTNAVCKNYGLWLKVEAANDQEVNWFFFNSRNGLQQIFATAPNRDGNVGPYLTATLKDGNIFTFDKICH